ncbi:hypothetical protein CTAYLR_000840 [Chrysophaeum taylorii]|uniref:Uncharacterized protein n=1 Tax=Chrysophaeum taylorii TaxID=2483200 RepID=A0AAD7UQZ0_9STRA|nr:hypothetical protein CTAYLR_000840 [Chrysophaeum taylorii]
MKELMLVTGGLGGIGRSVAKKWLAASPLHWAVLIDRRETKTAEIAAAFGERVTYEKCDVTNAAAVEATYARACRGHKLRVAVNNAGVGHAGYDHWQESVAVNLCAAISGTKSAAEIFREQGEGGCVINVASLAGVVPLPYSPVYSAAKAGVVSFVRSLDRQLRKEPFSVHALCPSFTDTPLVSRITEALQSHDADTRAAATFVARATSAQGGLMTPDVVADALMRIVSDAQTGQSQPIMIVTPQTGAVYEDFPKHKSEVVIAAPSTALGRSQ